MQVVDAVDYLLPEEFGFDLCHLPVWLAFQVAMETAAIDVFHDKEDLLV